MNGTLVGNNAFVNALSIDTREDFCENTCFFAIDGKNFDGAGYINEAVNKGAKLIVTQKKISTDVPVIYVENTVKALGLLAKANKGKTKIIGVTGSVGKTTVKGFISSVLREKYSVASTYKNYNNEIGVPLTLLSLKGEDFCVVEMGMRGMGQIDYLASISQPEVAVITNCGSAHIGILESQKNIFSAKTEILSHTSRLAVLPSEKKFKRLKSVGLDYKFVGKKGDIIPENIRYENGKTVFDLKSIKSIKMDSLYMHNAYNSAFAYAVGSFYGLEDFEIKMGIEKYATEQSRGRIMSIGRITLIDDTYNASYESMEGTIKSLKQYCVSVHKRPAVMLGDMCEQGERAPELHRRIGRLCKRLGIEKFITFGEESKYYLDGLKNGTMVDSLKKAAEIIMKEINEEYILLIKASRAMGFEKIIEWMKEENDKR